MYVATTTRVRCWIFEKAMGKNAWLFPLSRRFFSLLHRSYGLLAHHRRKETPSWRVIRLPRKVRQEFLHLARLCEWLKADLRVEPAGSIFSCDASLTGWAICELPCGNGFVSDSGVNAPTPFEEIILVDKRWFPVRIRQFRLRLALILAGEVTAFRQAVSLAAKKFPGRDIIVYTDNTNVYYATRKGRSNVFFLNDLCLHILLTEIVCNVRIHPRWCSTKLMPADRFTRL